MHSHVMSLSFTRAASATTISNDQQAMAAVTEWRVYDFFAEAPAVGESAAAEAASNRALLILNQPLCRPDHLMAVWRNTSIWLCADGGANRLYDLFSSDKEREQFIPTIIRGDLDSLRQDVRSYYESKGVSIEKDPNQDTTDFQKCIEYLESYESQNKKEKPMDVLVLGALSGRLDQTLASIATLFHFDASRRVILASNSSVAFLLRPTTSVSHNGNSADSGLTRSGQSQASGHEKQKHHTIHALHGFEGPCCGIASLGCDAHVVTTGLKWNLHRGMILNFDKLLSSSNAFGDDAISAALRKVEENTSAPSTSLERKPFVIVTVDTDQPVLWMADIHLD